MIKKTDQIDAVWILAFCQSVYQCADRSDIIKPGSAEKFLRDARQLRLLQIIQAQVVVQNLGWIYIQFFCQQLHQG